MRVSDKIFSICRHTETMLTQFKACECCNFNSGKCDIDNKKCDCKPYRLIPVKKELAK